MSVVYWDEEDVPNSDECMDEETEWGLFRYAGGEVHVVCGIDFEIPDHMAVYLFNRLKSKLSGTMRCDTVCVAQAVKDCLSHFWKQLRDHVRGRGIITFDG